MEQYHVCYTTPVFKGSMRGSTSVTASDPVEAKQKAEEQIAEDATLQSIYANHHVKYNGANGGDLVWQASRGFIRDNWE